MLFVRWGPHWETMYTGPGLQISPEVAAILRTNALSEYERVTVAIIWKLAISKGLSICFEIKKNMVREVYNFQS